MNIYIRHSETAMKRLSAVLEMLGTNAASSFLFSVKNAVVKMSKQNLVSKPSSYYILFMVKGIVGF